MVVVGEPLAIVDPFSTPLYRVSDAASYLGVPASTFREWVSGGRRATASGRANGDHSGTRRSQPVITSVGNRRGPTIPFVGLSEGLVLAAVRRAGVPLQRIRPALDALQKEIGIDHALASKQLYTDGAEIIFDFSQRDVDGSDAARELVVVRNGQRVFPEIVDRYLRLLEFGPDGYVHMLHLPEYAHTAVDVVADPNRNFGQPIFAKGAARVADVLDRIWADEPLADVADDFGLEFDDLVEVLRVASRSTA